MNNLPPTISSLLPAYNRLAAGLGYVTLKDLLKEARRSRSYQEVRTAIEREYVDCPEGWYFTTTRMGDDIQVQVDREYR